jgi:hypothetical protein
MNIKYIKKLLLYNFFIYFKMWKIVEECEVV